MSSGLQELMAYTSVSKYSRWLKQLHRRETWLETCERYEGMLVEKFPARESVIRETCSHIVSREVMPSMRGLQFGGHPIQQHNARIFNCTGGYCDRLRSLPEAFYLLLCGSGTGMSVQECHLQYLPKFSQKRIAGVKLPRKKFVVPDTIEGWSDTQMVLLSSWHEQPIKGFEDWYDAEPIFDFSEIRRKGSELSFGIGLAPGAEPLRRMCIKNGQLLHRAVADGLMRLNDVYASDFLMHEADAVLSGGVRRSATILIFDVDSQGMREFKVGNWFDSNPQRARANISALLHRKHTTEEQFHKLFDSTRSFGEPGFYWSDSYDIVPNPCCEISFASYLKVEPGIASTKALLKNYDGPKIEKNGKLKLSGWQGCNLTTLNGNTLAGANKQERAESFFERCQFASSLGTWQAAFTTFPYLGEVSEQIFRKEALLGVSIAGMMHHPEVFLDPDILQEGARHVVATNVHEADQIGINHAARTTCVKPDGNSAATLGCFSGCHPGKFREGFRIVQANNIEPVFQYFNSINPQACEKSVWGHDDSVIRFAVSYEGLMEDELTAVQFLDNVKLIQQNWVWPGKVKSLCTKSGISNNVSNTVRVRPDEWEAVAKHIYDNREFFSGVSLISLTGDRDYAQAPFTSVHTPEETLKTHGKHISFSYVDELLLSACIFDNLWDASALALNEWDLSKRQPTQAQLQWVSDLAVYAEEVLKGNIRQATYLLKDRHNYKLWLHLKESYKPVDYSLMVEMKNHTQMNQEVACAGGACET